MLRVTLLKVLICVLFKLPATLKLSVGGQIIKET